jgi:Tfp pilus assembly PilM family ATPase
VSKGTGLDIGHCNVRLAELNVRKGAVGISRYHSLELEAGEQPVSTAGSMFGGLKPRPTNLRVGATGADIMLRYLPVPEVEDWRLERLMDFEIRELESRSGSPLATSYNLLPVPRELDDDDTMLLGVIREDLLDEWVGDLSPMQVEGFTPNAVALYNAYLALGDHEQSVTLLANIGATSLDLALVRGTELYFARSVTTSLEKRDQTLASSVGVDAARARQLIHKHLDLALAEGKRVATDSDRVTRPLLGMYDSLPTLLSGMITLCKAQARLRELTLDRVLLTGGGAQAKGLISLLTSRLRVPVSLWNPTDMVDPSKLPEDDLNRLEADGPAATIALGLALSAADSNLFALEILSQTERKKRNFRERGVFATAAAVLALGYLGMDYFMTSQAAADAKTESQRLGAIVKRSQSSHVDAVGLLEQIEQQELLLTDLQQRFSLHQSAQKMLDFMHTALPDNLWIESFTVELQDGKDWGMEKQMIPVLRVVGRGEDASISARKAITEFGEIVWAQLPGGEEAYRQSTERMGQQIEWTVQTHLLSMSDAAETEEEES